MISIKAQKKKRTSLLIYLHKVAFRKGFKDFKSYRH
jgi:hypothetical protein